MIDHRQVKVYSEIILGYIEEYFSGQITAEEIAEKENVELEYVSNVMNNCTIGQMTMKREIDRKNTYQKKSLTVGDWKNMTPRQKQQYGG